MEEEDLNWLFKGIAEDEVVIDWLDTDNRRNGFKRLVPQMLQHLGYNYRENKNNYSVMFRDLNHKLDCKGRKIYENEFIFYDIRDDEGDVEGFLTSDNPDKMITYSLNEAIDILFMCEFIGDINEHSFFYDKEIFLITYIDKQLIIFG